MTFNAIALEIATLKRLGLFRKPISESNASRVVGRVTTVEMKMIFSSCPWKSSTVPTRMAPSERARSAMRMSTTCRRYVAITATSAGVRFVLSSKASSKSTSSAHSIGLVQLLVLPSLRCRPLTP